MIPGGRMNPRQMQLMMKRLGMSTEPIEGVDEVLIRTATEERVFKRPEVTVLTVQGVRTYQIVGEFTTRPRGAAPAAGEGAASAPAAPSGPPEEDVTLVMDQAGVDRAEAVAALRASSGEPAEAIMKILSRRGPPGG
ncbi:MAG TPA: nascent polypeptide-associated complex protein [Thermoplasmata archaeon]|nr:nascent polypeptide-associated complex protein [Thermoplasmata archaeon]